MDLGLVVVFLGLPVYLWFGKGGTVTAGALILGGLVAVAGALAVIHAIGIHCPRCTNRLERYYRVTFLRFRGPESCPHCGLDFARPAG